MTRVQGKVALVTGAASGIGETTAQLLAREGASVMVADVNLEGAQRCAKAITEAGGRAEAVRMDLGDLTSVRAAIAACVDAFGGLDVLHNNAADTRLSSTRDGPIETLDLDVFDQLMRVNVRGTVAATQAAIPLMRKRGGGSIIVTSSGAGLLGDLGITAYGMGKAALNLMVKSVATQHSKENIRCNAIAPGLIVTPATVDHFAASELGALMLDHHLTPRLGKPEDIAETVLFLASDASSFITGQVWSVDGGMTAHMPYSPQMARLARS